MTEGRRIGSVGYYRQALTEKSRYNAGDGQHQLGDRRRTRMFLVVPILALHYYCYLLFQ